MQGYLGKNISIPRTSHAGIDIGPFAFIFEESIPILFSLFGVFVTIAISAAGAKSIVAGFQTATGSVRKSMPNLPRSNFKERSQNAGAAIKNAFSTGSMSSPISSSSKSSTMDSGRSASSLHKRQTIQQETKNDIKSSSRPLTEITTHATKGAEDATLTIAAEFESSPQGDRKEQKSETGERRSSRGSLSGLSRNRQQQKTPNEPARHHTDRTSQSTYSSSQHSSTNNTEQQSSVKRSSSNPSPSDEKKEKDTFDYRENPSEDNRKKSPPPKTVNPE